MTDATTTPETPNPAAVPESQTQYKVAMAIVAALTLIAALLIVAGIVSGQWAIVAGTIGTIVGSLATALNAPTGIGKLLTAAKQEAKQSGQ
jgi:hypothetical protein